MKKRFRGVFAKITKGTRFEALRDFRATGTIHWNAPMTSSFKCVIPKGTILAAVRDYSAASPAFGCVPTNRDDFERRFVPAKVRESDQYAGYSFTFFRTSINKKLTPVS